MPLNVFDHQRFLVRRPDGTRLSRSFRELVTATTDEGQALDPDERLELSYPQPFYDVGAMGLLCYLAQLAFEPEDEAELVERLETPISPDEYERVIAPLRPHFTLDGEGTSRFMQGPPPERKANGKPKKKPDSVSTLLATVRKDNSLNALEWLNRPDARWVVGLDQVAVALFTRNTFYEQAGGAGYQKGTAGEVGVRTLLTQRNDRGTLLRRSIWLNLLCRDFQEDVLLGAFEGGYDGRMWQQPPVDDVPTGGTTLAAGLGWMTAYHYVDIEAADASTCLVSGRTVADEPAAVGVWKGPTGIAYGTKGDQDAGSRAERLFRHPNVPTFATWDKKSGAYENERQVGVHRTRGLVETLGGIVFGQDSRRAGRSYTPAPVVRQLAGAQDALEDYARAHRDAVTLDVFGFHMVGSMGGKHSAYEHDAFRYPLIRGATPQETQLMLGTIQHLVHQAAEQADAVARLLQRAVQTTAGVGVQRGEDDSGRISIKRRETVTASDFAFGRDTLAAYWQGVGERLKAWMQRVADAATSDAALRAAADGLRGDWGEQLSTLAKSLYAPHFRQHSTHPPTMPYAYRSRRYFLGVLKKQTQTFRDAKSTDEPAADELPEPGGQGELSF
jgi:hypothetical protein